MTQDKTSAAPPPPPSVPPQKKRQRFKTYAADRPLHPMSQSLVGVFVFALGVAAIIAVGYLAFARLYPSAPADPASTPVNAQSAANDRAGANAQPANTDMATLDLNKADRRTINGQWYAQNAGRSAYLTIMQDGRFQIIVYMDDEGLERRVGSGTLDYDIEEGVITLNASYDPLPEIPGADVKTLTRRMFKVIPLTEAKTGAQYWVAHGKDNPRASIHPVFTHLGRADSFIVWSRLKENR